MKDPGSWRAPDGHLGSLEQRFQASYFEADRRLIRGLMALVACFFLGIVLAVDLLFPARFTVTPAITVMQLLAAMFSGLAMVAIGASRRRDQRDRVAAFWLLAIAGILAFNLISGAPRVSHPGAVLFIESTLLIMPVPFAQRFVPAVIVALAAVYGGSIAVAAGVAAPRGALEDLGVLLLALGIGAWSSVRLNRARRTRFAADEELKRLQAEAQDLSRLIPVCAYCRQIRSDEGFWIEVEDFLVDRRIAPVAEARCDNCIGSDADARELRSAARSAEDSRLPAATLPASSWRDPEPDLGDLEAGFRVAMRKDELPPALVLVFGVVAFGVVDMVHAALAEGPAVLLTPLNMARLVMIAGSLLVALGIGRTRRHRHLDILLFCWAMSGAVVVMATLLVADRGTGTAVPVLFTLALYLLLPGPLLERAAPCVLIFAGTVVAAFDPERSMGTAPLPQALGAVLFANAIGVWASISLRNARRAEYVSLRNAVDARSRALLLERLMPICAGCHQVRNEEGYWEDVFSYLRQRSPVLATHGICPACLERELAVLDAPADP
ncbi:MAG TPA: hypothetical protein VLA56_22490 [Pseudomonadales bacterium]|nr:hypothetical protein [Pseudomonadales bacterium]